MVLKPYAVILDNLDEDKILKRLEQVARVCYKSEHLIRDGSAKNLISKLIERRHNAILEHVSISVKIITDRAVANELVRHRLCSFAQESTRYVNYSEENKLGRKLMFIKPLFFDQFGVTYNEWHRQCYEAEKSYNKLLELGATPEQARTVLPCSTKTEIVVTANIAEWRHILKIRCHLTAHPQFKQISIPLLLFLKVELPTLFGDIEYDFEFCEKYQHEMGAVGYGDI